MQKLTVIPENTGIYWYFNAELESPDYQVCEVIQRDGSNVIRFMNGSFQRFIGKHCFIGNKIEKPMKPIITENLE